MSCCGNKKDVNKNTTTSAVKQDNRHHNQVRATKVYGTDDTVNSGVITKGFVPIRQTSVGSYGKVTKTENYGVEEVSGSKSRMFGNTNELNFALDETPGVSNTFDVPTYDYRTLLSHNIYYNLNARSKIVVDDGNTSRVGMNQTTQNAK